ncbi:MAG TPA: ABC transporter substrate-binding protein [Gemmatimonadota bacterium]|nr:ABC transporter substrate-binding protein [Gemmatimonadota bacterium]
MFAGVGRIVLLAVVAACGSEADSVGDGERNSAMTIDLGIRPFLTSAPLYIAMEEGYFADEGLDVRIHLLAGHSATSLVLLEHGDIDVVTGSIFLGLFNAINEGSGIRIVADKGHFERGGCSPYALVVRSDLAGKLRAPASVRGLRIDINPSLVEGYFVESWLEGSGLSLDDLDVRAMPLPARHDAMNRGLLDLSTTSEPWLSRLLADGHQVLVSAGQVIPGMQYGLLLFGPELRVERREAGRRFIRAYLRGVQQYNRGKTPRNMEILGRALELDPAILKRACWPSMRNDGMMDTEPMQGFQKWGFDKGLVDRVLEPEEYWDPSLVNEVGAGRSTR